MNSLIIGNGSPLKVYLELDELYPCIPEEALLHPHVPAFDLGAVPPEQLPELLLPPTTAASLPQCCRDNDIVADVLKRNRTLRNLSVPRRLGKTATFGTGGSGNSTSGAPLGAALAARKGEMVRTVTPIPSADCDPARSCGHAELLVGYEGGVVCVWNLRRYTALISEQRKKRDVLHADVAQNPTPYLTTDTRSCAELLGYHDGGPVTCSAYHTDLDVGVTGCVDGSLRLWDVHGRRIQRYAQMRLREAAPLPNLLLPFDDGTAAPNRSADADPHSREQSFAQYARRRRLCGVARRAHGVVVTAVAVRKGYIISGGADCAMRVWVPSCDPHGRVTLTVVQEVPMVGQWVVSLRATESASVQPDDVVVTDDAGFCTSLRHTGTQMCRGGGSEGGTGACRPLLPGPFRVSRQKLIPIDVRMARSGVGAQDAWAAAGASDTASRAVVLKPIANDSLLIAIAYSPVVSLLDHASLNVLGQITHPALTAEGVRLSRQECSSVQQLELARRAQLVRWLAPSSGPIHRLPGETKEGGADTGAGVGCAATSAIHDVEAGGTVAEPLRFVDALFVASRDCLLLLDNRNCGFLWELPTRAFVAKLNFDAAVGRTARGRGAAAGHAYRALGLLPGGDRNADGGGIPFLVVGNDDIRLFRIMEPRQPVTEARVHREPVLGLCAYTPTRSPPAALSHKAPLAARAADAAALVSVSCEGLMLFWTRSLLVVHAYNLRVCLAESTREAEAGLMARPLRSQGERRSASSGYLGTPEPSLRAGAYSEVTAFYFHAAWQLAITGHDNGDVCFWSCDGELTHLVARERRHHNAVAAITATDDAGGASESILVTGGFDGHVSTWNHPSIPSGLGGMRVRRHVSFDELLCLQLWCDVKARAGVVTVAEEELSSNVPAGTSSLVLAGDAAGAVHFLSTKGYEVVRVVRAASRASAMPVGARFRAVNAAATDRAIALATNTTVVGDLCPHTASVVAICVLAHSFVTCDEDGGLFRWAWPTTQVASKLHLRRSDDDRAVPNADEVTCAVAVGEECFVVGTRSGWVFLFDCGEDRAHPIGSYLHSSEVTSLAVQKPLHEATIADIAALRSLALLVGAANGSITRLDVSCFFA